jgi:hypothetical protein
MSRLSRMQTRILIDLYRAAPGPDGTGLLPGRVVFRYDLRSLVPLMTWGMVRGEGWNESPPAPRWELSEEARRIAAEALNKEAQP